MEYRSSGHATPANATIDPLELPEPTRWEPWKDDTHPAIIRGTVVNKYRRFSDYAESERNFADVLVGETVWYLSGFSTRVHQELARINPHVGDEIGVKFLRIVERPGMRPYPDVKIHDYSRAAVSEVDFSDDDDIAPDIPTDEPAFSTGGADDDIPF